MTGKVADIRVAVSAQRFFCHLGALPLIAVDDNLLGFRDGKLRQARRQLAVGDADGPRDVALRVSLAFPDVQDERRRRDRALSCNEPRPRFGSGEGNGEMVIPDRPQFERPVASFFKPLDDFFR